MLSPEKLQQFIPDSRTYEGSAKMSFLDPDGSVSGKGKITLLPDGHVTARIEIEDYSLPADYRDLLMPFLRGSAPEQNAEGRTVFRIGGASKIGTLEISTPEGHFRASRALVGNGNFDLFTNENTWFEAAPFGLELTVGNPETEEMWCAPLFGDLGEFRRCANAFMVDDRSPYIHFKADGNDCGLMIFNQNGTASDFSAVVFGAIGHRPHGSPDEVGYLIPWGLFAALDFASGSDVRAPWIELRSRDGDLRRRLHLRFGGNEADEGFPAFSTFDSATPSSGVAEFLRLFFELPEQRRRDVTPTLALIRRGTPGSATVDECITNLVKALDATCKRHGLGRINLAESLDAPTSQAVGTILSEAKDKLKEVRSRCKEVGRLDQLPLLDRIISRHSNAATDELDFGIAVSGLLHKFGLSDGQAMEAYYSGLSEGTTWEGLLSFIRGEVVHSGAIHIENRAELVSWFELARHLHDISKRLILREVCYKGTYSPSNVLLSGTYALDRVTSSTTPAQLGYTTPPTMP